MYNNINKNNSSIVVEKAFRDANYTLLLEARDLVFESRGCERIRLTNRLLLQGGGIFPSHRDNRSGKI